MTKVTLRVTEIVQHKIEVDLTDHEIQRLRDVDEDTAAELIGGYMSNSTILYGEYEDPEIYE